VRISPIVPLAAAALALATWTGCKSGGAAATPDAAPAAPGAGTDEGWYEGTDRMRSDARSLIQRIHGASETERLEIARRLGALGEPAVPLLLDALATHPEPDTRSLAAWIVGWRGDRRVLPQLERATHDSVSFVALEAAAAMLRLGDDGGLPRLVQGLEDPDPRLRSKSLIVLEERTGQTMDFRPDDHPQERAAAVGRWRAWLDRRVVAPR
jgi:HEAT repeat protein